MAAAIRTRAVDATNYRSDEESDLCYDFKINVDGVEETVYVEPLPLDEYKYYEHIIEEMERGEYTLFDTRS